MTTPTRRSSRMGNDPTVLDHLGEIEARGGKLQQAIVEWQKSLANYATSLAAGGRSGRCRQGAAQAGGRAHPSRPRGDRPRQAVTGTNFL